MGGIAVIWLRLAANLPGLTTWRLRALTLQAIVLLCMAHLMVQLLPYRYWRKTLGQRATGGDCPAGPGAAGPARCAAAHVERAAARLPFPTKCLPQAMALCWLLRAADIAYVFKIAARPAALRRIGQGPDNNSLHAWVETEGTTVIGSLPGPWLVVLVIHG